MNWDGAIDHVRRGWIKGYYFGEDGGVCLVGGLSAASQRDVASVERDLEDSVLPAIIREQFPARAEGIGTDLIESFNDHEDTTVDDVILVLEKARAH